MVYHERFGFSSKQLGLFHAVFSLKKDIFNPAYAKQVLVEFVSAAKESSAQAKQQEQEEEGSSSAGPASTDVSFNAVPAPSGAAGDDDDEEDELIDKALEAMLDAQMEGYDGFEDDFDNLETMSVSDDDIVAMEEEEDEDEE